MTFDPELHPGGGLYHGLQTTETRLWTTLLSSALVPVRGELWDTIHHSTADHWINALAIS